MSIFLNLAQVTQEELVAGRISIKEAKHQLSFSADLATALEFKAQSNSISKRYSYNKFDKLRETRMYESLCNW